MSIFPTAPAASSVAPRFLLGALAVALAATAGAAELTPSPAPEPPAAPPALAPAWFDLIVNEVPKGTLLVQLSGRDVWVRAEDLTSAGLTVTGGDRVDVGGTSFVSLASLAPAVSFVRDEGALEVRVTAGGALLGRRTLDLAAAGRPELAARREVPSGFLNLAGWTDALGHRSASSELGYSAGPGLLLTGLSLDTEKGLVRGLSTFTWDDPRRLIRYGAGDLLTVAGDALGGAALVGGVSAGREFSLDPYFRRTPYPRTTVFATTPATLEVWVNDTLQRRERVVPGTIDIENVPANAGLNEVRTVIRDAFGREQSASTFALVGSNLIARGVVDWRAAAGFRREDFGTRSFDYGEPLAVGSVRAGVTETVSAGARMEAGAGLLNGGGSVAAATSYGEVEGALATSRSEGLPGVAAQAGWRWPGRRAAASAQVRVESDHYANAALPPDRDRALLRGALAAQTSIARRLSLMGDLALLRMRDSGDSVGGTLRLTWAPWPTGQVSLAASRSWSSTLGPRWELSASLVWSLPRGHLVSSGARTGGQGEGATVSVSRGMRAPLDLGYRVTAAGGAGAAAGIDLYGQSPWGRAEAHQAWSDPWSSARGSLSSVEAASGVVLIDGRVYVTRPVDGSYALLVVDGAPGVRAYLEGQEVGRTNAAGRVFIPGLMSNLVNRLSIATADLPLDFKVNEGVRSVIPRFRGGTVERFDVGAEWVITGKVTLRIDQADVEPVWGEIAVELPSGKRVVSPIGTDGTFWLEGLPPGRHEALIRWEGRLCRMTFEVRQRPGIVDLGAQRCSQMLADAEVGAVPGE
jgi:outer membrane usher protein